MNKKFKFLKITIAVMLIVMVSSIMFTACDGLFENNNSNNSVTIETIRMTENMSFKTSSSLRLQAEVTPADADGSDITYSINQTVTTAQGARIVNNILYADGEGVIGVFAKASNGVQSETVLISVLKEPVISVTNTNDNKVRHYEFENFDTASTLSELGWSSVGKVDFLTNDSNAKSGRGMIGLRAQDAGIYKTFELNPYESVSIKFYTSNRSTDAYKSYYIVKIFEDGMWRNYGDTLTCNIGDWKLCNPVEYTNSSNQKKEITIGFFRTNGNSLFVNPTVFIDDMSITISSRYAFMRAGTQLELTCTVLPLNATHKDVTYQIISSETTAGGARIENGMLYAQSIGQVKIYPIADGVYGEPFIIEVI